MLRHDHTGYLVIHAGGEAFARIPSHLREDPPAVGDRVALDLQDLPTIRALLPRRSAFTRHAAGRITRAQVVAANVDTLFIVAGTIIVLNARNSVRAKGDRQEWRRQTKRRILGSPGIRPFTRPTTKQDRRA